MPVLSVGDMSQQFISMRNGGAIKSELGVLSQRLSTGRVDDLTAHLRGETTRYAGINHSLAQLDSYLSMASETQQTLSAMQTVLQGVDAVRSETAGQLLLLDTQTMPAQVDEVADAVRGRFETMVSSLNTRYAERSLFGGAATDTPPLASGDAMLADIQTAIGAATTQADITTAIEFWFDDPAGGFATMGYQGDLGPAFEKRVSENRSVDIDVRADDPAIRDTLKAMALAAVTSEIPTLTNETKRGLLQDAGLRMFVASDGLVAAQSRLGFSEGTVERTMVEMGAQRTSLATVKNDLSLADPFDNASRLQAVQLQLETHYAVTARMSQLSLVDYI